MRLQVVVILFTCMLGIGYSAPYASSEALLQEIRKLVAEEESHESVSAQKQEAKKTDGLMVMWLCAQTGQGSVAVTPEDVQRAVAKAKAQEKISAIIAGVSAAAAVGSLGTGINSAVNGQKKRNAEMTAQDKATSQEKITAILAGIGAAAGVGSLGTSIATTVGDQSAQSKATSQEKVSLILGGIGAAAGVGSLGTSIADAVNGQQLAAGKSVQVPLSDMLCTPIALGAFEETP